MGEESGDAGMTRPLIASICVVAAVGVMYSRLTGGERPLPVEPALEREQRPARTVKGHFAEANIGKFDLVDGIAWPDGPRTVVYVVSKPIASGMLAGSACPATMARALTAVRNAGWVEVTIDPSGKSDYFASGTPFGGTSREKEVGGNYWSIALKNFPGAAAGTVTHKEKGSFEFSLFLTSPRVKEVSESDRSQGRQADAATSSPTQDAMTAAYRAAHDAALKKDWTALLTAIGFNAVQAPAIRALEGIDADLEVFADRFLKPGAPGETEVRAGHGVVQGEGVNSKGAKFINYYWFTTCQDQLILYSITENPQ